MTLNSENFPDKVNFYHKESEVEGARGFIFVRDSLFCISQPLEKDGDAGQGLTIPELLSDQFYQQWPSLTGVWGHLLPALKADLELLLGITFLCRVVLWD